MQARFDSEERNLFWDTDKAAIKYTGCQKPCSFDQYKLEMNANAWDVLNSG